MESRDRSLAGALALAAALAIALIGLRSAAVAAPAPPAAATAATGATATAGPQAVTPSPQAATTTPAGATSAGPTVAKAETAAHVPAAPAPPAAAPDVVPVPAAIVAHNVPPVPRRVIEGLAPYDNMRSAALTDWHPRERRLLVLTRFAQANQLHEVAMPGGARTQLTFWDEPVMDGLYRPSDPAQLVAMLNAGGAENYQLVLVDRRRGTATRFTDGVHRYESPLWSHSGALLAYVANARNGRDFDLYVADPSRPGSERRVAELVGQWTPLDWSPDDRRLLIQEFISASESYLHAVDVTTGRVTALTPPKGGPTVAYQGGRWAPDGRTVYTASDRGSELLRLVRLDPATGTETVLSGDIPWDVDGFDLASDGAVLAFAADEDGISRLHLLDTRTGRALPAPDLPAGVVSRLRFRRGTHELGLGVSWARSPQDVYSWDADRRRLERWTASETGGLDPSRFAVPRLVRYPTFDAGPAQPGNPEPPQDAGARRTIPAFVYAPDPGRFPGRRPVYLSIHGGPEAQFRPGFLGALNYVVDELGIAVVAPNVRGSSGYGKTYLALDNGMKREDSVKDVGALLDWIATQPGLDAGRVMVAGGSYGGYMALATMTHYSDRLACGFDSVGISNFVTFLQHTQAYRRDLRRVEYGDERNAKMRAFLESIAPVRHAAEIRKPLLIAAGANDPRVPVTESDQIAAAVEANGVTTWYVVAKDEGHGFQKKDNSDYLRMVSVLFAERYLLGRTEAQETGPAGR